MKILVISAQKPDSTGSGVYLNETVRAFIAAGHDVAVIAGIDRDDDPELAPGISFYPVRFRTPDLPFPVCGMSDDMPYEATRYRDMTSTMVEEFTGAFRKVIESVIEDFDPDLIICHHLYLVTAVVVECEPDCPVVAISHSTDIRQMRMHNLEHDRIVCAMRKLDEVLALHHEQVKEIVDVYGVDERRIRVVGTGYNAGLFHSSIEAEVNRLQRRKQGRVQFIYAGKIWRKKGVESLIKSLSLSGLDPKSCPLVLAGGYNDADEYAKIVESAVNAPYSITFIGKLSQEDLAEAYRDSDIFVLPSFFEGLPLVVVEALASGCSAVITDLPGIRSWIEEYIPNAPVTYVEPPLMKSVDEPYESELPAFEEHLGKTLGQAAREAIEEASEQDAAQDVRGDVVCDSAQRNSDFDPSDPSDPSALLWETLADRIIEPYF